MLAVFSDPAAPLLPTWTAPALIVSAPLNVLEPVTVRIPAPSFVTVPAPVLIGVLTRMLPAPPKVRFCASSMAVALFSVSVPESELMRTALPSVIAPANVLSFKTFRSAPPLETPVPFSVSAFRRRRDPADQLQRRAAGAADHRGPRARPAQAVRVR